MIQYIKKNEVKWEEIELKNKNKKEDERESRGESEGCERWGKLTWKGRAVTLKMEVKGGGRKGREQGKRP